jgi:hypothetical protein
MKFDPLVVVELKIMADQIRSLNQSIVELEKTIADQGIKIPGGSPSAAASWAARHWFNAR